MRLSATIQSSSVGRAVVGRAGRLDAKRVPIPRMQAVEFQGRGGAPAQYEKVLAGGYVSGEWSLPGTRFGAAGGERRDTWVELEPRCTAEGLRKAVTWVEGLREWRCRRDAASRGADGSCKPVVPLKASKDDKLPKIKSWDMEGPPVRYIQTGGA
jgi:hypothetical protein